MDLETSNYLLTKSTRTLDSGTEIDECGPEYYEKQMRNLLESNSAAGPGKKILKFNQPTPQALIGIYTIFINSMHLISAVFSF